MTESDRKGERGGGEGLTSQWLHLTLRHIIMIHLLHSALTSSYRLCSYCYGDVSMCRRIRIYFFTCTDANLHMTNTHYSKMNCGTIAVGYFTNNVSRLVFPNMEAAFQLFLSLLNMSLQCQPTHTRPHSNLRWLNCQHRFKGQWKRLSDGHPEY